MTVYLSEGTKTDQSQTVEDICPINPVSVDSMCGRQNADTFVEPDCRRLDTSMLRHFRDPHEKQSRYRLTSSPLEPLA